MPVLPLQDRVPESDGCAGHGTGQGGATLVHRMVRICPVMVCSMECLGNPWNVNYRTHGKSVQCLDNLRTTVKGMPGHFYEMPG